MTEAAALDTELIRTPSRRPIAGDFKPRGESFIFLTGGALALAILMISALIAIVLWQGLATFWPKRIDRLHMKDGSVMLGTIEQRELGPGGSPRIQVHVGNRDVFGAEFRWIDESDIEKRDRPKDAVLLERRDWGPAIGFVTGIRTGDDARALEPAEGIEALAKALPPAERRLEEIERIDKSVIGEINRGMEEARLERLGARYEHRADPKALAAEIAEIERREGDLGRRYDEAFAVLQAERTEDERHALIFETAGGLTKEILVSDVVRVVPSNDLGTIERLLVYGSRVVEFVTDDPRSSNTEGGVFPAIFGTVLMTLLMTIAVVPFGVIGALYLREYAKQGALVSVVRIAVNNLAGVPSIVFGVFGLGFFCYAVGGTIDQIFFPERLPSPTLGGGGILWASLTLALLTVPVVVVATEEALAAVPNSLREASYGCGASRFQTIRRIVIPRAMPGILTGVILAMARGAGEVAPLMLTGAVHYAPTLPMDGTFPFLHPERRFMHLGYHIFAVGLQSPNAEAARPMVFSTTLLLLLVVLVLNIAAIVIRNRLRRKFRSSTFG